MLNYSVLSKNPAHFRNFSGLEVTEFDALNSQIKEKYPAFEERRLERKDRKRRIGAGHPFNLSLTDRLLMLLVYYRLYLSSNLMAYLFNLSQSNILKDIKKLEPLASEVLPLPRKEHDKIKRLETIDEIEALFPGFKAFLDATEQEIPRPHDKRKRKSHCSGKERKFTVKTQITVNREGLIVHKSAHAAGSTHDYALYKHSHPDLPGNVRLGLDLGYKGVERDYPKLNCVLPFKRNNPGRGKRGVKGPELSADQKAFNHELSRERIVVEHTFSRLKKFHMWADEFRNHLKRYDKVTDIVCGLVNFRTTGTLVI
jgi:hypothetical protein